MNLSHLNQVTTPEKWKIQAMEARPKRAFRAGRSRKKFILVTAAILCLCCGTAVAAGVIHQYQNGTIVADNDAMAADIEKKGLTSFSSGSPNGPEAISREEMMASLLEKAQSWTSDEMLGGTVSNSTGDWTSFAVDSAEGPLWERHIYDTQKNVKTEFVSQSPTLLLDRQVEYASWDLTWMETQYESLPYGNLSYLIEDKKGNFLGCYFSAFYLHGETGYIDLDYYYTARHINWAEDYVLSSNYDQAEECTTPSGLQCILTEYGNQIWVSSQTPHFYFSIYAADMDFAEIKEILDHLEFQLTQAPEACTQE